MKSATLGNVGFLDEVNTADIESIEITRGPGSVLYSSKAVGGTINVITRDPPRNARNGRVGRCGQLRPAAPRRARGGFVGEWRARTFGQRQLHLQDEGWRDRSEREKQSISGKFVMKPDADTKVTFRSEYVDAYREYPGALTEAQFEQELAQGAIAEPLRGPALLDHHDRREAPHRQRRRTDFGLGQPQASGALNACPAGCSSTRGRRPRKSRWITTDDNLRGVYRQDFDFLKSRVYAGVDAFLSEKNDDTYNRKNFHAAGSQQILYHERNHHCAVRAVRVLAAGAPALHRSACATKITTLDVDDRMRRPTRTAARPIRRSGAQGRRDLRVREQSLHLGRHRAKASTCPAPTDTVSGTNAHGSAAGNVAHLQRRYSRHAGRACASPTTSAIITPPSMTWRVSMPCPQTAKAPQCPDSCDFARHLSVAAGKVGVRGHGDHAFPGGRSICSSSARRTPMR